MIHKNQASIEQFLIAVANREPVLAALSLAPADLKQDSFEQLLNNAHDVGRGVTAVGRLVGRPLLGLFTQLVVKQHDDGSAQYQLSSQAKVSA